MDGYKGLPCSSNAICKVSKEVFLSTVALFLSTLLSGSTVNGFSSNCGFSDCWDLYQLAQESLRISDIYPLTWVNKHSLPSASLIPAEIEKRCTAFRTFYKCLAVASRGCLGDLNFHSAHKGTEKQMNIYGCSPDGPVFEHQFSAVSPIPLACTYNEGSEDSDFEPYHRMCGIFGSLHMVMFDEKYLTCNIIGAWPMFDNEHFTIQVTAEKPNLGSHLAKVTIVIKQDEECALADRYVLYQATSLEMPTTFSDGSTAFGTFDSIRLEELEANRHVSIIMRHIDTTIWIHSVQHVLSIFIKTPDEFANSLDAKLDSMQLCFTGCPNSMQVKIQSFFEASIAQHQSEDATSKQNTLLVTPKQLPNQLDKIQTISYKTSYLMCISSEPSLKGYFLNSCIYDIMSSRDSGFTILSAIAMNTTLNFGGRIDNSNEYMEPNARRHTSHGSSLESSTLLIMLLLLCNLLNHSVNDIFVIFPEKSWLLPPYLIDYQKFLITFRKNIIAIGKWLGFIYLMLSPATFFTCCSYLKPELFHHSER